MTYSTIPDAIREVLVALPIVEEVIGERIHYQTLPQESTYPHIYYYRQSLDFEDLIDPGEKGMQTDRFVMEIVAEEFDESVLSAMKAELEKIAFSRDGMDIHLTEVTDVDDQYEFRSADGDALFVHGWSVQVYFTED